MRNLFIVFEGIDGSGTSTQSNMLYEYFNKNGKATLLTCEPSNGPIGNMIRQGMKKRIVFCREKKLFDEQMAYLFAADRHDHLYNEVDGIMKALEENIVISTRYYFSSLAYHCRNDESMRFVAELNAKFPQPDFVIYIDIPIEESIKRLSSRYTKDIYETKEKLFSVASNYKKIFDDYSGEKIIVLGTDPVDEVHRKIVTAIKEKFPCVLKK